MKACRLYKPDNPVVVQIRSEVLESLVKLLHEHGGWTLSFTPTEIRLGHEPVVSPSPKGTGSEIQQTSGEEMLPFLFYRDGIRAMTIPADSPQEELETLFDALKAAGTGPAAHEDLVTLLWQANLTRIQVDSMPIEQTIYLGSAPGQVESDSGSGAHMYAWTPRGAEVHADLGQATGSQGLHRDVFDDWDLPDSYVEVPEGYAYLLPTMEYSRSHFQAAWEEENAADWVEDAPRVLREIRSLDPSEETAAALCHAVVTWIGSALQRCSLEEAQKAVELLKELDPEGKVSAAELASILSQVDHAHLCEFMDEAPPEEQARFAALAVALGKAAVGLVFSVMSTSTQSRTRAAASTALCYLCADEPQLLSPHLGHPKAEVVLDVVFVLGQIGGPEVLNMLRLASQHPDPRVRKQVIHSMGSVPAAARVPQLVQELSSNDPNVLVAALHVLAREKNPRVAQAIFNRITTPGFETLPEELQLALFTTLAEVAGDEVVPALEAMVKQGGWLARRSFVRTAAARTLQRIGTADAEQALREGLKSRNAAIRATCQEALGES